MTFEELKNRYEGKEVTQEEFEEIEENEYVREVENNGNSGQHYNLTWYTVYGEDDEFDIYG
ncbi:hypothetical protein [Anaerococcus vaginalis]|uniref:hypothetical protein n=1 Tax=Anaerococcus vaginalis TaxID=33037 RepID=UPI00290E1AC0|nr:hypothetical protein [Anaerococcus vaginalis]MDU5252917.1 hypothetical protein [Anaerococcus vaginalis]MDU6782389.1 hypothetical protein [Anaerococcus vaginalis]